MPKIAATVFLALSAAFILWLGHGLPETAASHFDAAGRPDGSMPRAGFAAAMVAMAALLPLAAMLLPPKLRGPSKPCVPASGALERPGVRLPRAVPEAHAAAFAVALSAFMDFVAWRVALASQAPGAASLAPAPLWLGVAVFLLALAAWSAALILGRRRG